jgi:signal transduction histidine kinase
MVAQVLETGRPAKVEDYDDLPGAIAAGARESGLGRTAGAPIVVGGSIWGVMGIASPNGPLPDHAEDRLAQFTELVGTAIANGQARDELTRLADEQAALRRVATLAAKGAAPSEVVEAVSVEVARLIGADAAGVTRFDDGGMFTVLGGWTRRGGYELIGRRFPLEGSVSGLVFETRRPVRIDTFEDREGDAAAAVRELGWRSAAGAPILVEDRLWGVLLVYSKEAESLPVHTETRLAEFTEIVATAIANTQNREEITRLADEQAALRRVATLAARGAPPEEVVAAAGVEVGRLLDADGAGVMRYDADGMFTSLGGWTSEGGYPYAGRRFALEGSVSGLVFESRRPSRIDSFEDKQGEAAALAREIGCRSAVGAPVFVEGRLWGAMVIYSKRVEPLPLHTETRLAEFTEIVAAAIANAESRAELEASRARIVSTADATRRRIERDLHDGAQQQLVSLALEVRAAQGSVPKEMSEHRDKLSHIVAGLTTALDGLREIALGVHPAILAEGGLGPALKTLAHRSPIPVLLDGRVEERLSESVEVAAYYIVSEALTNAAKHARASKVDVEVVVRDRVLRIAVADDGVGGADPARGSGLLGIKDRAAAIGGTVLVASRPGAGTSLVAELPLGTSSA